MKHFTLEELIDRNTYQLYGEKAWELFNSEALIMLDDLREFFGFPVTVNNWWGRAQGYQYRGYRPQDCRIGATHSEHKKGNAFDCDIEKHTAEEARRVILDNKDDTLLCRIMRMEEEVPWLHIDRGKVPDGKKRIYVFRA